MTCLGKWVLASAALHLLAAAGMAMLCASAQKPAVVIDLSQLGHSCREPEARQAGGVAAKQEPAPPAAPAPRPVKQKRVVQERPPAKSLKPAAQPATAANASGDNATATAAASGSTAAYGQAGSGSGGAAGNGDRAGSEGAYRGRYFGFITDLVQKAAVYPLQARRMGWQGTVTISFIIRTDGSIADAAVLKSSGHAALDASALGALKKLGPLPSLGQTVEIRLPVVYLLTDAGYSR